MSVHFRLLTEDDVRAVVTMDDLIDTMTSALDRFSIGRVVQPVRTVIAVTGDHGLFATMPAFVGAPEARERADFGVASPHLGAPEARERAGSDQALGAK